MTDSLKEKVAIATGDPWATGQALCREPARRSGRVAVRPQRPDPGTAHAAVAEVPDSCTRGPGEPRIASKR
jgi:hypothetical protein